MAKATKGSGHQTRAQRAPANEGRAIAKPTARAVKKPSVNGEQLEKSPADASKNWVSAFLRWSEPYRALASILAAIVVSVSGGVAWVVAHFATQSELHFLECRMTNSILAQLLPVHIEEFAEKIDWRSAEIKALAQHGGGTPQSISTISDLTEQVNALNKDERDAIAKFKTELDEVSKSCISEAPQTAEISKQ